jgi:hypothetical protein
LGVGQVAGIWFSIHASKVSKAQTSNLGKNHPTLPYFSHRL